MELDQLAVDGYGNIDETADPVGRSHISIELVHEAMQKAPCDGQLYRQARAAIQSVLAQIRALRMVARPIAEWHEDMGPKLWWRFPVVEPPYVGDPRWEDFPDHYTHWTDMPVPWDPTTRSTND